MPKRPKYRFAVVQKGVPKCLLTAIVNPNGDVIVNLRLNQADGTIPRPFDTDEFKGKAIRDSRLTIHKSDKSSFGINTINLHHIFKDGTKVEAVHYSTSIKNDNNFAPLYARLCSSMAGNYYDIGLKKDYYTICHIDNNLFTLCFMVFLGPATKKFSVRYQFDFSVQQIVCGEFSIVILWSWLSLPPNNHGLFSFAETNRPHHVVTSGYDEANCIQIFFEKRTDFRQKMISTLKAQDGFDQKFVPLIKKSTYFKQLR